MEKNLRKASAFLIIDEEYNQHLVEVNLLNQYFPGSNVYELDYDRAKNFHDMNDKVIGILVQISFNVDKDFMSRFPNLKAISVYGGGFNNVDIKAASELGIKVARAPDYSNHEVAEYAVWSILNFAKKPLYLNERAKQGYWGARAVSDLPIDTWDIEKMEELPSRVYGSNLLIIGYGKIGKTIATKAKGLGMNIYFYDPYISSGDEIAKKVELEEGLKLADYVCISAPLTESTRNLINYERMKLMKKTAYLINVSRGGVVNESDLIKALSEKVIRGAALDVFEHEPLPTDSQFYNMPNVVVTPHAVYVSDKSIKDLKVLATLNLINLINGKKVPGCVNC